MKVTTKNIKGQDDVENHDCQRPESIWHLERERERDHVKHHSVFWTDTQQIATATVNFCSDHILLTPTY